MDLTSRIEYNCERVCRETVGGIGMGSVSRNAPRTEDIKATSFASCDQVDSFTLDNVPENRASGTEDDLFKHLVELETTEFTGFCNENVSKISDSVHNPNNFFDQTVSGTRERCQKGSYVQGLEHALSRKKRKMAENGEPELLDSKDAGKLDQKSASPKGLINPKANTETPAVNRHNLAERIRRERINERLKLLQGLVPGCDKIMGKAVMLDEIINYILSLQHQVEFLYTKLAAVNLGERCQPYQIPSKDICPAQGVIASTEADQEVNSILCPRITPPATPRVNTLKPKPCLDSSL